MKGDEALERGVYKGARLTHKALDSGWLGAIGGLLLGISNFIFLSLTCARLVMGHHSFREIVTWLIEALSAVYMSPLATGGVCNWLSDGSLLTLLFG